MSKKSTLLNYQKRIKRVLIYIEQHLDDDIPLDKLADIAHFSAYHFHRVFTGLVGESVKSYIRRLRLERAAKLLTFTNKPITEIAMEAEYNSLEAFSSAFRDRYGETPTQYRTGGRKERFFNLSLNPGEITMNVEIKQVTKMKVASVRHVGPYMKCDKAWQKLLICPNIQIGPDTIFLGVCYDDPQVTEPNKIRYDACVTVSQEFMPTGDVEVKEVAGGKYAITRHIGPYDTLHTTYEQLVGVWCPQNGVELRSEPPFEIYINDPRETKPEELITDIYIPIV